MDLFLFFYNYTHEIASSTRQLFSCLLNSLRLNVSQTALLGNTTNFEESIVPRILSLELSNSESESYITESQSYVTTDGQSASLSWNKAPIWGLRPDIYYCQIVAGLLIWGALSDERTGLWFTTAAGPRQCSHSRVQVPLHS
jgi:hypothetical protein